MEIFQFAMLVYQMVHHISIKGVPQKKWRVDFGQIPMINRMIQG